MIAALDLFCGAAGGWSLGLHRAGVRTIAACEIDEWRGHVFARRWPGARMYADVRELTADRLLADTGRLPDWIVGSPPCQDASCANAKGRGVDGDRTGLFFEAVRLVGECRPAWACFENVPGIRTRGADRVLIELEALDYACWPLVVGAVHAGAPHRRQRVWIIAADAACWRWPAGPGPDVAQSEPRGGDAADANGDGLWQQPRRGERTDRQGKAELAFDLTADAAGLRGEWLAGADGQRWAEASASPVLDAGDADSAGLAQWQGVGGDALEELPPAIRAVAEGSGWNGGTIGLAGSRRMVDGLSTGMDRAGFTKHGALAAFPPSAQKAAINAYGDAVLPQITEAIARAIISVSPPARPGGGSAGGPLSPASLDLEQLPRGRP